METPCATVIFSMNRIVESAQVENHCFVKCVFSAFDMQQ